jgi:hypothetical protein
MQMQVLNEIVKLVEVRAQRNAAGKLYGRINVMVPGIYVGKKALVIVYLPLEQDVVQKALEELEKEERRERAKRERQVAKPEAKRDAKPEPVREEVKREAKPEAKREVGLSGLGEMGEIPLERVRELRRKWACDLFPEGEEEV